MSRDVKKRRAISLETKREVIENKLNGTSVNTLVQQYDLPRSTILTILKNQTQILSAISQGGTKTRSRCTSSRHAQLESALLNWIEEKTNDSPLSGQVIQNKAKEFAVEMGIENFKASNGWLQKFNSRYRERFHVEKPIETVKFENWQQMGLTANDVLKQLLPVDL
ncbi:Tigger transposable element-derived protein 4-like protein [Aphelenchoides besseyi]|nr:Tigger transposable element-derived protein 4-like protein [Aphelenchoides besseyi]